MFLIEEPSPAQIARFRDDGFLVVERLIAPEAAVHLASRFGPLFRGEFETGLYPDEWNWREGRDAADLTRQICNAWKSDRAVARVVLHPRIGLWCAPASRLAGGADQSGQRAVEAAGRAPARLPPGRQLPAVGGAPRDVHLLDRARRDQCERRHRRVRGGLAALGPGAACRPVSRPLPTTSEGCARRPRGPAPSPK